MLKRSSASALATGLSAFERYRGAMRVGPRVVVERLPVHRKMMQEAPLGTPSTRGRRSSAAIRVRPAGTSPSRTRRCSCGLRWQRAGPDAQVLAFEAIDKKQLRAIDVGMAPSAGGDR